MREKKRPVGVASIVCAQSGRTWSLAVAFAQPLYYPGPWDTLVASAGYRRVVLRMNFRSVSSGTLPHALQIW